MDSQQPESRSRKRSPAERMRAILAGAKRASFSSHWLKAPSPKPLSGPAAPSRPRASRGQKDGRKRQLLPVFWTIASAISMTVNVVLLIVLVAVLGRLKALSIAPREVGVLLLGGLYSNFEKMDRAHIRATIPVTLQDVPVRFDLPYEADTVVVLTEDTPIRATVRINAGIVNINGPADIVLPAGARLPIHLNLVIPVDTTVDI